ncbi:hypothetical protein DFS34DRAFT_646962 [Phlyctochytrium arcticum]|nr:hypothetical protein DFS34DRAFT_646962 [Phlyctochytrium arcticum]
MLGDSLDRRISANNREQAHFARQPNDRRMVTDNPEQDPFDHLHNGLSKLRLQNNNFEAKMDALRVKNIGLVTEIGKLQAMLAAKCTDGQNGNLEARMEKIETQNVDLVTEIVKLQAMLL